MAIDAFTVHTEKAGSMAMRRVQPRRRLDLSSPPPFAIWQLLPKPFTRRWIHIIVSTLKVPLKQQLGARVNSRLMNYRKQVQALSPLGESRDLSVSLSRIRGRR